MDALLRASRGETPPGTPGGPRADPNDELRAGFAAFDREGTGFISVDDTKALCYALGVRMKRKEIRAALRESTKGDRETIDLREFRALFGERVARRTLVESDADVFRLLDVGSKGRVTAANLQQVGEELGADLGEEDAQEIVDEATRYRRDAFTLEDYARLVQLRDTEAAEDRALEEKLARRAARNNASPARRRGG